MPIHEPDECLTTGPHAAEAIRIISRLRASGFVAYMAGGCVRDALLGRVPKDYDVATDATPDAIRECFGHKRTLAFGAAFGVIGVLPEKGTRSPDETLTPTEVATFRSDGEYSDGRRPNSVHFGTADADALRRDFTINGLFYDPIERQVIDYVGGLDDLDSGMIRTIGDPIARFGEDKLRMLRAVRFATTLGMQMDTETFNAIVHYASEIRVVSRERIGAEMRRVLASKRAFAGLALLDTCNLSSYVLESGRELDVRWLRRCFEGLVERSQEHGAASLDVCESLALLSLAHPQPTQMLAALVDGWKLSNEEQRQAMFAIRSHKQLAIADQLPWSLLQPLLIDIDASVAVGVADAIVRADGKQRTGIERAEASLRLDRLTLDPPPLLTGNDLHAAGIPRGPIYRTIIERVRAAQLDGEISTMDEAMQLARTLSPE